MKCSQVGRLLILGLGPVYSPGGWLRESPHGNESSPPRSLPELSLTCSMSTVWGSSRRFGLLTPLLDVEQWTLVIGECCRVEDLDARVVVAGKRRCGSRTACLHGILRRIEPNPEVIKLHRAISYRARL